MATIDNLIINQPSNYPFLRFIKTNAGSFFYVDENNECWRMYHFVENCCTINVLEHPLQAKQTAYAFAQFTQSLQGIHPNEVQPSIPRFHDLAMRYEQFEDSIRQNLAGRVESITHWIDFLRRRRHYVDRYLAVVNDPDFPVRIVHADAKISNVLFRQSDLTPYCVIDYDTLMPGYFFSDLGDMVRSMVCSHDENEPDTSRLSFRSNFYTALIEGYSTAISLTEKEKNLLHFAGPFMTYMQALRFATDYLKGDNYYSISYKAHNLDRLKNQCVLLELIENYVHTLQQ